MALTTKTQSDLVNSQVAAIQASCASLLDFTAGSVLLAIAQAIAAVGLWLQAQVIQLAALTRLATCFGTDVDSFIADFGMTRLPAASASGVVTFARFSSTAAATIPIGATVESADGTLTFAVTLDTTNALYVAGQGYVMPAGLSQANVPVSCTTSGVSGNVSAGFVSVISDAIPGVDTVTNPSAFSNGVAAETDAAVKIRFVAYINSRSQGTPVAVDYAVESVAQGLTFQLVENYNSAGQYQPGYFYLTIDDGSSLASVPQSTLLAVSAAVYAARPLCSQFGVFSRVLLPIVVNMTITGGSVTLVTNALSAYIAQAGLGGTVSYSKLTQVAFNADPNVTGVSSVTLNGGVSDIVSTAVQRPVVGSVTVL